MKFAYTPQRVRLCALWLWFGYVLTLAWFWLGVFGLAVVSMCWRRYWRNLLTVKPEYFSVDMTTLRSMWLTRWAICVQDRHGRRWLCCDEVGPASWAQLQRELRFASLG